MMGSRLKLAREAAGLSLRELANAVSHLVSAQAIGKYERNEMMPSSTVLLALSSVLKASPQYLLSAGDIELMDVDFRKAPEAGAKEIKAVEASVLEHVERYLKLEELLQLPSANWQAPDDQAYTVSTVEEAEAAADKLRMYWQLGRDPISDLAEVLEEKGIKVIARALALSVFGSKAMIRRQGHTDVPAVIVNSAHTGERQRLTLAHELAHLVLRPRVGLDEEKAANRFAGAFLVPSDTLRGKLGTHRSSITLGELVAVKRHFRVSVQVLVVRSYQAKIISKAEYGRTWGAFKESGFLDPPWPEPEPLEAEKPRRMERLCLRALAEDALSEAKAAEYLQISVRELERRLEPEGVGP